MGLGYSSYDAEGSSPESAIKKLMKKVGRENYGFCFGHQLEIRKTTPGFYETNITALDWYGTRMRAEINRLERLNGDVYYRAWFGLSCV